MHAVSAPVRDPFDLIDRSKRIWLHKIDPNKELFHGAKDHRRLGTPTKWIGVMVIIYGKQTSNLGKSMNDVFVRVKDVFTNPFRNSNFLRVAPVVVYWREERKPIFKSGLIILLTVARCCVHATGPGV